MSISCSRFQDDVELAQSTIRGSCYPTKPKNQAETRYRRCSGSKIFPDNPSKCFKDKVLFRVFSEEYDSLVNIDKKSFDPHGHPIHRWNQVFLIASLVSLFVDPLFFFLPGIQKINCIEINTVLMIALTVVRSIADVFYAIQIYFRFRTAFVAPSSRVFGRGELVIDPSKIARRYLSKSFWLDLIAALPLPQSYLQSTTVRLEEWRVKKTDMEQWMHHRQLPLELKQCVRRYYQYKWVATQGVDEEALLKCLPLDLRREIKRHLCLDLVRRVPLFNEMDERMLEAICERLRPALYTEGTCVVRELDPVGETLFVIRGNLDSWTTQGGRSGFFNSCRLGPGEFCGEELLPWALDPRPNSPFPHSSALTVGPGAGGAGRGRRAGAGLPRSTRTVRAVSDVEAFALAAEDLKEVAAQFRRLHSREMRHRLRFHSHQWRAWAACFIQAAWRRRCRRRAPMEIRVSSSEMEMDMRRRMRGRVGAMGEKSPRKPSEPDYSLEGEEEEEEEEE